jgi:sugar lactone lactonase YvrE
LSTTIGSWEYYTSANSGLPVNKVNLITIDTQDRKWFGTSGFYGGCGVSVLTEELTKANVNIYANTCSFTYDEKVEISVKVDNPEGSLDMYAAFLIGETLYFYPSWDNTPHATEIEKGIWDHVIFSFDETAGIPDGSYNFYTAITKHNTTDVIGLDRVTINIDK